MIFDNSGKAGIAHEHTAREFGPHVITPTISGPIVPDLGNSGTVPDDMRGITYLIITNGQAEVGRIFILNCLYGVQWPSVRKFFLKSFQQSKSNGSSNLVLKKVLRLLKKRELHFTKFILGLKAANVEAETYAGPFAG